MNDKRPIQYESGFRWVHADPGEGDREGARWNLFTPRTNKVAATVFCYRSYGGHNWFVWDKTGAGGENSCEPTIEAAMITAESAVLRWGKHAR